MPKRKRKSAKKQVAAIKFETAGRELVVIARAEAGLRASAAGLASVAELDVSPLAQILASEGATMRPLFGVSEDRIAHEIMAMPSAAYAEIPDLSVYYRVDAPESKLDRLAAKLRKSKFVTAAYVKPPAEPAQFQLSIAAAPEEAPPSSPDFTSRQQYLDAAPVGIDAQYAWTQPGGGGAGVKIIDVEGAWNFSHEDLLLNQGGVVGGTPTTDPHWRNHGTAVAGEFSGDRNTFGITGICPDANLRAISVFGGSAWGSAPAIRQAATMLGPGDIILIELHRGGPRATGSGQFGYIAIEWWPDDFAAIQFATSKGVIVVEAAGNGEQNLDDPVYNNPAAGFPSDWTNPFNRANRDSGAILAGAGNPPVGTHGRNTEPIYGQPYVDRARCSFSNYGTAVDVQGWGWEVTSTGYGDLQGGSNENLYYTDTFSGTSSASPIIVGTLGCVQGWRRATGATPWTPAQARNYLRTTGSPQQAAPSRPVSQRVGNRPDLRQLIKPVIICAPAPKPCVPAPIICKVAPKPCPPAPIICKLGPKPCPVAPKLCPPAPIVCAAGPKSCPTAPKLICPPAPKLVCPPAPLASCPPAPKGGCIGGPMIVDPIDIKDVREIKKGPRKRRK